MTTTASCKRVAGQTEAFGTLVARYQDRLYPTVLRLIGSAEDAEDVLQDAFVRAFEKLDQFQGDSSFYTWIYRIAVNLALSGYRRRRARSLLRSGFHRRAVVSQEDPADLSPDSDPTVPVERAEREKIVEAALNKLGPEHRAVVVLKDFDGHRYEEISAILGVPVGTVRSRLHRTGPSFVNAFGVWLIWKSRCDRDRHSSRESTRRHERDSCERSDSPSSAALFA